MSQVKISGDVSGTGTLTVAAPNTNSNFTLTLPAATGTFNTSGVVNEVPAGTAALPAITTTGDTNTGIFFPAADTIAFTEGGVEAMRIDSAGNVGIGTSSPAQTLHVKTSTGATPITLGVLSNSTTLPALSFNGAYASTTMAGTYSLSGSLYTTVPSGAAQYFSIADSIKATLDSSGNLGLGVTPSASTIPQFEGGANLIIAGRGNVYVGNNVTFNSSFKYISTAAAAQYNISGAEHRFLIAPSGTAGNAISFTQAMTLDASGNLRLGTTSDLSAADKLTVVGGNFAVQRTSGITTFIGDNTQDGSCGTITNQAFAFLTNSTERMRIDSSGNFILNKTTTNFSTNGVAFIVGGAMETVGSTNRISAKRTNDGNVIEFYQTANVGTISITSSATAYNTTSDYRLKTVIGPVANAGQRIDALQPVEYTWNASGERTRGFLAHQFAEVYAGSVSGTKDAVDAEGKPVYQAMQASTSEVIADLVAEIQSLRQRLSALEQT